jgi:hypothetical protein
MRLSLYYANEKLANLEDEPSSGGGGRGMASPPADEDLGVAVKQNAGFMRG